MAAALESRNPQNEGHAFKEYGYEMEDGEEVKENGCENDAENGSNDGSLDDEENEVEGDSGNDDDDDENDDDKDNDDKDDDDDDDEGLEDDEGSECSQEDFIIPDSNSLVELIRAIDPDNSGSPFVWPNNPILIKRSPNMLMKGLSPQETKKLIFPIHIHQAGEPEISEFPIESAMFIGKAFIIISGNNKQNT
jgi:hypothetical protein